MIEDSEESRKAEALLKAELGAHSKEPRVISYTLLERERQQPRPSNVTGNSFHK